MTMQSDDMEAVDRYMKTTPVKTPAAQKLRDDWIKWYDTLGWYGKSFTSSVYDDARNRKNAFNLANTISAAEKQVVQEQLKTAFTTEEARGEPRRMLADGTYNVEAPDEPFFPTRVKIAAGVSLAGIGVLWGLKKLYIDPFLPKRR